MRKVEGLLFIGDPHLSSRKPGRRTDSNFAETVLRKLEFLIDMANEKHWLVVFLGDLFDSPVELDEQLKTKLARLLRKLWTQAITNIGNHDIKHRVLTDGDSLAYLAESGLINLNPHSGALETVLLGQKRIGIGATPYGQDFPLDARPFFSETDQIIWLTHHDIAFENPYPGSVAPQAIQGCKLVINGHMHLKKPIIKVGSTVWFNPGNITRQAVDAMGHAPAAHVLLPTGGLEVIPIPHEKSVFDLTGKLINAVSPGEVPPKDSDADAGDSVFVNLLKADSSMEMTRSDDGSILLEEITEKLERERTPAEARAIILQLHKAAVH